MKQLTDSGLNLDKVDKDRVGVIWASGIGGLETFFLAIKELCSWGWDSPVQSILYPQNDWRYCSRSQFQ